MAGVATEEGGGTRPALADWRSLEQVENGTPSTSPPYWEIEDGEDGGQKPSDLYGKYTWKIDKFSQINKRELRSNAFEVGGYKWYILIYPQGCDVCNHLSLFLCVANHDKLRPGWSHFAQFTISVVNKDPKKSKYSDTLHRFRKKEHDWGWKKFMELPKVMDGFIDADTLKIKAQVQVIRERAERPFRCLDCQYRRELVRVYLTNVEQLCVNFVGERQTELEKLMEDKARWTSFCAFWLGMDQSSRQRMSQERTESILKVMVKQFFVDKEVSSTLVMDSLYSGLKALQGQNTRNKSKGKYMDAEESPRSVILIEEDMFVLVDDVLLLIERAAMEPLPLKEEKGPQNRTKDGSAGEEFSKDSIERDEKRLTELGRRTIEIFVLSHIFSKIEVAYKEAVSLMRQEELIREEEAAWRGAAEKKFKKKQGKHKKANRKGKDKAEQLSNVAQDKVEPNVPVDIKDLADESEMVVEKSEAMEYISDASDSVDFVPELLPLDSEDIDAVSPDNWDIDTPELHHPTETSSSGISVLSVPQIGTEGRSPPLVDDNSSTYSDESIPSVAINVPHTGNYRHYKNIKYPTRRTKHQSKVNNDNWVHEETSQPSEAVSGAGFSINASQSSDMVETMFHADVGSLKDRVNGTYRSGEKEEDARSTNRNLAAKDVDADASRERTLSATSPSWSPSKSTPCKNHVKLESKANTTVTDPIILKKSLPDSPKQVETTQKFSTPRPTGNTIRVGTEKTSMPMATPIMSRPLSAPLFPAAPATRPSISVVHTTPALSRSVSASGCLGPTELSIPTTSSSFQSYLPQSYRNAIIGNNAPSNYYSVVNNNASTSYTHNRPLYLRNSSDTMSSPGMVNHDALQSGPLWMNGSQSNHAPLLNDMQSLNLYNRNALADEFPHLDIINDLLDDEYVYGNTATSHSGYHNIGNGLNRQFSFQGDTVMASGLGPSCRFERTRSYHEDGFQHGYGGYDIPQASPRPYLTGQIDGLMPNQWQMPGSEMPFRGNMNDGYPCVTDYPNISVGVNSFSFFRP